MKQILQSLKDGSTQLAEVPMPMLKINQLLIETALSLVSAGTERSLVEFGKANLIQKVRQQPEKVREVVEKVKTDGLSVTVDAVRSKLDQPLALGYCNVGRIHKSNISGFSEGDRVVSNGNHAEFVVSGRNLCAKIPSSVSDETASFTILAAIGLQGIRLANLAIGETVTVYGLGVIGLLTVQILKAQGCRVLGIDVNPDRIALAQEFGIDTVNPEAGESVLKKANSISRGIGMDAVLITATTSSDKLISEAATICRKRAAIVLIGVVGLNLNRADFYEKEITLQVSCSYGPGRYDTNYEEAGIDYPVGFVRWTEQRNFEAILDLMASGVLDVEKLITHRYEIDDAAEAIGLLTSKEASLGIILKYRSKSAYTKATSQSVGLKKDATPTKGNVGFIGAGNYAGRVLIPTFKSLGASLHTIVSSGGVSAVHYGKKFNFEQATTDVEEVYNNSSIDTVVVATRHNDHAKQVLASLRAGKHVFCEKPLCLNHSELSEIEEECLKRPDQALMVGFNRRFAPHIVKMKELLGTTSEPMAIVMTINAGEIPQSHWTQQPDVGGGRIIGEACHFIDLARYLVGFGITDSQVSFLGTPSRSEKLDDKVTITLHFDDGSIAMIHYLANGHKGFPKERVEVFASGRILQLDNFRKLRGWGWHGFNSLKLWRQNKGQISCVSRFLETLEKGAPAPISKKEIFEATRVSLDVVSLLREH